MSVEKVFWSNPYQTEIEAIVKSVSGSMITIDRTIFFAFSGGQESDSGTINEFNVVKAEKIGKEIYYTIDSEHNIKTAEKVFIRIDWPRRYRIMRLHFAAELVLELIYQKYNYPEKIGAHIGENKSRIDFSWVGNIAESFPLLQKELKRIIENDIEIKSEYSDPENETRYWEIEGIGRVACGGTHLRRTSEVGELKLKRENIGKGKERVEITLVNPGVNLGAHSFV